MRATARRWRCTRVVLLAVRLSLTLVLTIGMAHAQSSVDSSKSHAIFDGDHTYQTRGGDIRFTISGDLKSQPDIQACLRWKVPPKPEATSPDWTCGTTQSLTVRRVKENQDPPSVVYAVTIPYNYPDTPPNVERTKSFFPIAELVISPTSAPATWHEVRPIGITSRLLADVGAIASIVLAGWALYAFARYLGVPGPARGDTNRVLWALRGGAVLLRIISTAEGWASLAQLQIILWTFVVGAGAVYVMMLTGSLIPISGGVLSLLGIAGGAAVLAEVKDSNKARSSDGPPSAVTPLIPGPQSTSDILISWSPPQGGPKPTAYVVQYAEDPATPVWQTATNASRGTSVLRGTSFRVVGLTPGKEYGVRVMAANNAGSGPPTDQKVRTATGAAPSSSVTGLRQGSAPTGTSVSIQWTAEDQLSYNIESRLHDSDEPWAPRETGTTAASSQKVIQKTINGLKPESYYDFRVTNAAEPDAWSYLLSVRTLTRVPKWSDIVTDTDKPAEIDVTRVQMLFFTVISALFVALSIFDTGTIPAIDPTYVTLMGISNGVYITAKFVRD